MKKAIEILRDFADEDHWYGNSYIHTGVYFNIEGAHRPRDLAREVLYRFNTYEKIQKDSAVWPHFESIEHMELYVKNQKSLRLSILTGRPIETDCDCGFCQLRALTGTRPDDLFARKMHEGQKRLSTLAFN